MQSRRPAGAAPISVNGVPINALGPMQKPSKRKSPPETEENIPRRGKDTTKQAHRRCAACKNSGDQARVDAAATCPGAPPRGICPWI